MIDIFHKLCDILKLPRPIDFMIWGNMDLVFFSFISVKALISNCGLMQLRSRVSAVQQPSKPCHANTLVENYKMAVVGAARYYHLFGMASLSDSSNRVPASGISVGQAEESAHGLKGNRPENRGGPGVFQVESPQEIAG